jgi:hypothetical protein
MTIDGSIIQRSTAAGIFIRLALLNALASVSLYVFKRSRHSPALRSGDGPSAPPVIGTFAQREWLKDERNQTFSCGIELVQVESGGRENG